MKHTPQSARFPARAGYHGRMITKLLQAVTALAVVLIVLLAAAARLAEPAPPAAAVLRTQVVLSPSELLYAQRYRARVEFQAARREVTIVSKPAVARVPAPPPPTPSSPPAEPPASVLPPPDPGTAQDIAYNLLPQYGFNQTTQFTCLVNLWNRESGWNYKAEEPTSGAYGIPQSLPASKMAEAGSDYLTNPRTQVIWGIADYIKPVYGTPCNAYDHDVNEGWY